MNRYGEQYYQAQMTAASEQPIIEVNGQLRFGLPGTPVFPDLTADTILHPRLEWILATDKPGKFPAEFSEQDKKRLTDEMTKAINSHDIRRANKTVS